MKKGSPKLKNKGLLKTPTHKTHETFWSNNDFFHRVLESLEDYAVFTLDKKGIIQSWNRGAEKVLGYKEKEVICKSARILFTNQDNKDKVFERHLRVALKTGKSLDQRWHLKKGKVLFWASGYVFPLKDDKGKVIGFAKVMRDITETKNARLAIEHTQERLALAQKVGKVGSFEWSILENKIIWSPELEVLYGLREGTYKDSYEFWLEKIHPEDRRYVVEALTNAIRNNKPYNVEFRVIWPNGKEHWLLGKGSVFSDEKGKAIRMVGVNIDICDLKDIQHERDQFISIASHELKTPVTSLKLFADILHKNVSHLTDPAIVEPTQMIKTQVNRLTNLMNDLLDISRIQSQKLELSPSSFDLSTLIQDIIKDRMVTNPSHKIVFETSVQKPVYADKARISQVVTNLISNAIKYSPQANKVVVKVDREKDGVRVSVQDFGIGIPPSDQEKIFEQFYRSVDAKNKHIPGFGLGLHITSEIIKRHGGKIWFKSTPNKGTTFFFTFPYKLKLKDE